MPRFLCDMLPPSQLKGHCVCMSGSQRDRAQASFSSDRVTMAEVPAPAFLTLTLKRAFAKEIAAGNKVFEARKQLSGTSKLMTVSPGHWIKFWWYRPNAFVQARVKAVHRYESITSMLAAIPPGKLLPSVPFGEVQAP